MTLPDVNVIVQAFPSDGGDHELCRNWLNETINSPSRYGMAPQVLGSAVRVFTHPRVFAQPSRPDEVLSFCNLLLSQPHCMVIQPGERHWTIFSRLATHADARGNLVPDAWLAALAIESGCEWITLDRDYARFRNLRWSLPS